jgi:hypothetical protein
MFAHVIGGCVTGLWELKVFLLSETIDIVPMAGAELGSDILAAVAARNEQNKKRRLIDLQELIKTTQFSKQEIMIMYRGFKQVRYNEMNWI